ncbi:MAG TPA: GNAT family N-acetyltransferase [Bryobacteraceae bacterium]|nr:GNAT family N-acetyltransferase [Bryobacteraceae bacterium]
MPPHFVLRQGTPADVATIVAHRRAMFHEMGYRDEDVLDQMSRAFAPWLEQKMQRGEYLAWFAVDSDGAVAAGLGLWLMDWPPHILGPGKWRANIVNVYTRPDSRRVGLARRLMETALAWCQANEVSTVILHSSDAGRPLYESIGFKPTNEMRIVLDAQS